MKDMFWLSEGRSMVPCRHPAEQGRQPQVNWKHLLLLLTVAVLDMVIDVQAASGAGQAAIHKIMSCCSRLWQSMTLSVRCRQPAEQGRQPGMSGKNILLLETVAVHGRIVDGQAALDKVEKYIQLLLPVAIHDDDIAVQAASGAGQAAMDELELQTREVLEGKPPTTEIFPFQVLPCPHSETLRLLQSQWHSMEPGKILLVRADKHHTIMQCGKGGLRMPACACWLAAVYRLGLTEVNADCPRQFWVRPGIEAPHIAVIIFVSIEMAAALHSGQTGCVMMLMALSSAVAIAACHHHHVCSAKILCESLGEKSYVLDPPCTQNLSYDIPASASRLASMRYPGIDRSLLTSEHVT